MKFTTISSGVSCGRGAVVFAMAVTLGTLGCGRFTPVATPGTGGATAAGGDYGAGGAGGGAGAGGAAATLLSGEFGEEPRVMLIAGDTLYYATPTQILSLPVAGGTPTSLAPLQANVVALAADAQSLYWAAGTPGGSDGQIGSIPLTGGTPTVLADGQASPSAIAVDDLNVYWMARREPPAGPARLAAVPKTGGGTASVLADNLGGGTVAAANGVVIFDDSTQTDATISSQILVVDRNGGVSHPVATSDRRIRAIATDGTTVFWIDANDMGADVTIDDGRIKAVLLSGGAVTLLADGQPDPRHLVLTADDVSWANQGSFANTVPGNTAGVWRSSKAGGGPRAIVSGLPLVRALAVDAGRVAYVEETDTHAGSWSLLLTGE